MNITTCSSVHFKLPAAIMITAGVIIWNAEGVLKLNSEYSANFYFRERSLTVIAR